MPEPVELDTATVRVFLGTLAGDTSPVRTFTPLLGAEIILDPSSETAFDLDPTYEHAVLVDTGDVLVDGTPVGHAALGYTAPGVDRLRLRNRGSSPARVLLLGGPPFGEEVVMWWNFMGRTHDEIVDYRTQWNAEVDVATDVERFGLTAGYDGDPLHAPPMPTTKLKRRT